MPQFAANLSMLYPELPFLDRFEAAANDGFRAVEYLFPYAHPLPELQARLRGNGLSQVLFNTPPGGLDAALCQEAWAAGARGSACVPGQQAAFRSGLEAALRHADALACPRVHVMVGVRAEAVSPAQAEETLLANLLWASQAALGSGVELLIEPINPRSVPGFFLNRQDHAHRLVQAVNAQTGQNNVKVQMDLFHCQIIEGDLSHKLKTWLPTGQVGHIQIADAPDRHEPGTGEIHWPHLFALIDRLSAEGAPWSGWIGCEYTPADNSAGGTARGLLWRDRCSCL
jgi:2-dehydrotetronate isomerase